MKELTPEEIRAITESRRGFLKQDASDEPEGYKTDQQKMLPQPPLTKAPVSDARIDLPRDFKPLGLEKDLLNVIFNRCVPCRAAAQDIRLKHTCSCAV